MGGRTTEREPTRDRAARQGRAGAHLLLPGGGGYGEVLANRRFRQLWLAHMVAGLGEAVASIAMPLLAYDLTGSAGLLGLIFVIQTVPRVILSPVAGLLADRLDRRLVMLSADLGRAVVVALLPFTTETWQIGVLAALVAVGNTAFKPAELAAVPSVVEPALLVRALSVSQVSSSVIRVVGPAIGAGIIGLAGPRPAFWLQALCFLVSAALLRRLVLPRPARQVTAGTSAWAIVRRDVREGLAAVTHNPVVRGTAAVEALWQLVVAIIGIATLVYLEETAALGDQAGTRYALLTACFGGGTVLGALAAARVERRIGRARLMAVGYLAPLMLVPAGWTPPLTVLFGCWILLGFADAWAVIAMQAYLAEAVPDALRGRVYATWTAVVTLAAAGWFAVVGWATDALGPPATIAAAGGIVGLGGPLLLLVTGALAAMRHHISPATRAIGDG